MPANGGKTTPESTSARRCTGVVTSSRGAGTCASARATSSGKNGRPACTASGVTSGISTDSSMPYMCCGGTVATTCGTASASHSPTSANRSWRVLVRKLPQVLGLGFGAPVLPEVKPIATSASSASCGMAPSRLGNGSGSCQ